MTHTAPDNGTGFPGELDFMDTPSPGMQLVVTLVEQFEGAMEFGKDSGTESRITFKAERVTPDYFEKGFLAAISESHAGDQQQKQLAGNEPGRGRI